MTNPDAPIIYLVRHGETEWNVQGRRQGHGDSPLTVKGCAQAVKIGKRLQERIDQSGPLKMFSSPLGRAQQSALILAAELGCPPEEIIYDPRLKECSFGLWEGLSNTEIKHQFPKEWAARTSDRWNKAPPQGERYADVHARVSDWYANAPLGNVAIVVCHGLTSRVFRGLYADLPALEVFGLSETQGGFYELKGGNVSLIEN